MIKLTLSVFLLSIIATGICNLEDINNSLLDLASINENTGTNNDLWLQQFQGLRRNGKPCRRRSNNPDEPWLSSYSSQISHPLFKPTVSSQISHPLFEPTVSSQISHPQYEPTISSQISRPLFEPAVSSQIPRPLFEPAVLQPQALKNEEYKGSQVSATPENVERNLGSGQPLLDLTTDDDCVDQLGAVKVGSSVDPEAEKTALKIIEDCLKKKKNQDALSPSRRSMSDPDSLDNNDSNVSRVSEDDNNLVDNPKLDDDKIVDTDIFRRKEVSVKSVSEESSELVSRKSDLSNSRICYACSTASNPTCWAPTNTTTIKYCINENSCVTKTFGVKNQITLIRDCANSCADTSLPGIDPKYRSCNICHENYCNSAINIAINGYSLAIVLIISIVKCIY